MKDRRALKHYYDRRALAPAAVFTYTTAALTGLIANNAELFPFFSWSLFSSASNPKADIILLVRSIDGAALPVPTPYYDMVNKFAGARNRDTRLAKSLDRLHYAVQTNNKGLELRLRRVIEGTFLREAYSVDYDVTRIVFDPIERLQTGALIRSNTFASYAKRTDASQ